MRTCSTPEHGGIADQISLAIEGGTFNVRTATCGGGTYCIICVGLASCAVNPNPTNVSVGSSSQATATGTYTNGSTENDTSKSSWSSSNTSIATVQASGQTSPGLVTGVSGGTATITADIESLEGGKTCGTNPACTVNPNPVTCSVGANVCDFTISPVTTSSNDCTNGTKQSVVTNARVSPSLNECQYVPSGSSCSGTASGNVELAVGSPQCNMGLAPTATVYYFSGPKRADDTAGTIYVTFTVQPGSNTISHTQPITITCP